MLLGSVIPKGQCVRRCGFAGEAVRSYIPSFNHGTPPPVEAVIPAAKSRRDAGAPKNAGVARSYPSRVCRRARREAQHATGEQGGVFEAGAIYRAGRVADRPVAGEHRRGASRPIGLAVANARHNAFGDFWRNKSHPAGRAERLITTGTAVPDKAGGTPALPGLNEKKDKR